MLVWFKKSLPRADPGAGLKAFFNDDNYHMVLTPEQDTIMPYAVAATAWNARTRKPNGTGRLLGCKTFTHERSTTRCAPSRTSTATTAPKRSP